MERGSKIGKASNATPLIPVSDSRFLNVIETLLVTAAEPARKVLRFMRNDQTRRRDGLLQKRSHPREAFMKSLTRPVSWLLLALVFAARGALAGEFFEADGYALHGYDPIAYFDSDQPVKGSPQHAYTYKGSRFLFASEKNLKKFAAHPETYAPQYRGFCALGAANGYKVSTQPDAYKVVDGKLYLNHDRNVLDIWKKDEAGNIQRADHNWPDVSKMPMKQ
jgi:YHS domain-containing protein